jgi:hypothetical protein
MEQKFSPEFRRKFLIIFTKELIKNSTKREIAKLQNIVETEEKRKGTKPLQKEIIPIQIPIRIQKREITPPQIIRKEIPKFPQPAQRIMELKKEITPRKMGIIQEKTKPLTSSIMNPQIRQGINRILVIPEPKLPKHLEYLKPLSPSTAKVEIDLGKINPLLKDPAVKIIEGSPDERAKVMGNMGTRITNIILTKEDVDRIINKFSEISKIPKIEGIYRVVVGNLILSAIISDVIGSRFVIKKMTYQQNPNQQIIPRK